jgi:hypothetical protein
MKSQVLNFDSNNATLDNINDPFSATFPLSGNLHNVTKISLRSIEMPVLFENVRNTGTLNKFTITISNVDYSVTITPTNYTSMSVLCSDITSQFSSVVLPNSGTLALSTNGKYVSVVLVSSAATNFTVKNTQLAFNLMGFKSQSTPVIMVGGSSYTTTVNAQYVQNLSVDNYLNFTFVNIPALGNSNASNIICSFKIPLNATYTQILYLEETQLFRQHIELSNSGFILTNIKVAITDRFGNQLINNGNDYSFTLEFHFGANIANNIIDGF